MTWIDFVLIIAVAALTALGAQRRISGLVVGLGGVLLFRTLLTIADANIYFALFMTLVAGVLLGLIGRSASQRFRSRSVVPNVLGGLGGALLGIVLVLGTVTSLPVERNLNNQIVYPPEDISPTLRNAFYRSALVDMGRDILLFPLLDGIGQIEPGQRGIYRSLHNFFVVTPPWEGES